MSRPSSSGDAVRQMDGFVVPMTITQDTPRRRPPTKTVAEIVRLMTQDPPMRERSISEIERSVLPAILLKRFHIPYAVDRPGAAPMPVHVRIRSEGGPSAPTFQAALRPRNII